MQKLQATIIVAVAAIALAASSFALLTATRTVPNTGNVKAIGVGVYWDSACTNNVTAIDWGLRDPGATPTMTVYIKNPGTVPVVLSMTTQNWNPTQASNYITLSWNRANHVLNAGAVVQATLTLTISSSISGITSYSFQMVITGTEQT